MISVYDLEKTIYEHEEALKGLKKLRGVLKKVNKHPTFIPDDMLDKVEDIVKSIHDRDNFDSEDCEMYARKIIHLIASYGKK